MMYTMECPYCGVKLRGTDVKPGQEFACPNIRGGCGKKSTQDAGVRVPKRFRIGKVV